MWSHFTDTQAMTQQDPIGLRAPALPQLHPSAAGVAVPEVSRRKQVQEARAAHEEGWQRQRIGV